MPKKFIRRFVFTAKEWGRKRVGLGHYFYAILALLKESSLVVVCVLVGGINIYPSPPHGLLVVIPVLSFEALLVLQYLYL